MQSLAAILALVDALRRSDLEAVRERFDPDVCWCAVVDRWTCRGRDEVLGLLSGWLVADRLDVTALELQAVGDRVILGVRSPRLDGIADAALDGQVFVVFELRDGRIVRAQDHRTRHEARTAAGVSGADWG